MGSFRRLLYHTIITPYKREKILSKPNRSRLYKYIAAVSYNYVCPVYAINGTNDHIHILVSIKHDILISDYMKKIKISSSIFIKEKKLFPYFKKWSVGYSVFTCDYRTKDRIKKYIGNQEEHHRVKNSYEELHDILDENGLLQRSTLP